MKKNKVDLFLSPDGYLSLRTKIPQIPVIHDVNFIHDDKLVPGWHGRYIRKYFPKFAQKAEHILTVSSYSADDISKTLQVDRDKISVCYNGVSHEFCDLIKNNENQKSRQNS